MAEIARIQLDAQAPLAAAWQAAAQQVRAWAEAHQVHLRDTVMLVPLAQHLAPARRAFARTGGWLPRVETARTLQAALPPGEVPPDGAVSFDAAQDRLRAAQLLRGREGLLGGLATHPKAFEQTVARLVDCAHRFARRHAALPPTGRAGWTAQARALLGPAPGPGASERLLARVALEWVVESAPWPGDVLFRHQPAAWVALCAGGADPLAEGLMQAAPAGTPCLLLDADPPADNPLLAVPPEPQLSSNACDDFEDEAERAAAEVLALLARGEQPVALIALDRELVRRIGALLARQAVPVQDETGWKLSTTRAASGVMALLKAAGPHATTDDLLDWLKALPAQRPAPTLAAIDALERQLRRVGCTRVARLAALDITGLGAEARDWALAQLAPLADGQRRTLSQWLTILAHALQGSGQAAWLAEDAAGQQVERALRLRGDDASPGWRGLAQSLRLRLTGFVEAVDALLEQAVFEPPAPPEPAVVITPLRRAVLRPFAAAVVPGADARRLGAAPAPDPLLGDAIAVALGLPGAAAQQRDEAVALAQLLRVPQVRLLYRHHDEGEALGPSLLLQRLALLRERAGRPLGMAADPRLRIEVERAVMPRPAPRAPDRLPAALSASAIEALRDCPYRFFSRSLLRLQEPDELEEDTQKRDYGTWLHAVLWRFHAERGATPRSRDEDTAALKRCGELEREAAALDAASFLPFEASFERFVPHYAQWLQERDAQGAAWLEGEVDREAVPAELGGLRLKGRLDRVDRRRGEAGEVRELIDYKTVSVAGLRQRVRDPLEDTQLAFYAALEMARPDAPAELEAMYLALDDSGGIVQVAHPGVTQSAQALIDGLAGELRRLRAGAPLPALGEGLVCEHCEARGLCRRDHWPAEGKP
jgi:ATP-dependent helicase/nuclease subunit B